ncbi:MAG: hypothetical protein NXH83_07665 [Rhodobacteraceae bacterium]|nr:hypothetical protein [Paracoccaceae bacterium]
MSDILKRPADRYSPLYFLASLGAGGLAVTFFMWLYFWVPHPDQPVPVFEDIAAAFGAGDPLQQAVIVAAALGIAFFAFHNIRLLVWNLASYARFRRTEAYAKLRSSNAETQITAMPLALAMTINVGFILGMVFVPGLWSVVEYLFPLALAGFLAVGVLALSQIGAFLGRIKTEGGFDWAANNSFAQVLPAFALSMVGVGLAAPAALSTVPLISGIALVLSTFFLMAAVAIALVAIVLAVHSMSVHGVAPEAAPTLLIVIPLITVLGILVMRQNHGLHVHFGATESAGETLALLTKFLSVQVLFGLFGLAILRRQGYARRFLFATEHSVSSYALVCPGVALNVMLFFWINKGLVGAGLIAKFGIAYWGLTAIAIGLQLAMIWLVFHLNRRHFGEARAEAVPAE